MHQLKSVDVISVAKILGILYGCLGLIFIPFALLGAMFGLISGEKEGAIGGIVFVIFAIFMPVIYGAMGLLMGALTAWIYNLIAKRIGGIRIELQPVNPPAAGYGAVSS